MIDARQPLDVVGQPVEEDARQRMAGDLRQARIDVLRPGVDRTHRALLELARADHQDAFGTQVDGGADRRELAHRAVAEELVAAVELQRHRREHERDRARGEDVLDRDRCGTGQPLGARPRRDRLAALEIGDVLARGIARCRDGERAQLTVLDAARDALRVDQTVQQRIERAVVEQRARMGAHDPAHGHRGEPVRGVAERAQGIGAVDVARVQRGPGLEHGGDGHAGIVAAAGERRGVDRPGRGAADDRVGIAGRRPAVLDEDLPDRVQHADLVGGPGSAAHQDQPGPATVGNQRAHTSSGAILPQEAPL